MIENETTEPGLGVRLLSVPFNLAVTFYSARVVTYGWGKVALIMHWPSLPYAAVLGLMLVWSAWRMNPYSPRNPDADKHPILMPIAHAGALGVVHLLLWLAV